MYVAKLLSLSPQGHALSPSKDLQSSLERGPFLVLVFQALRAGVHPIGGHFFNKSDRWNTLIRRVSHLLLYGAALSKSISHFSYSRSLRFGTRCKGSWPQERLNN